MTQPPQFPPPIGDPSQPPQQPGWQYPPPYQPQGYGPPPGFIPRGQAKKTHKIRNFVVLPFVGLIVLIIVIAAAASAGGDKKKVNTGAIAAPSSTTASGTAPAAAVTTTKAATTASVAVAKAHVGSTISLKGENSGEKLNVTLVQVATTTKATDGFSTPPAGDRYYAAQFRLVNTGAAAYSDAADNDSIVLDAQGQQYQTDLVGSISAGPEFADQVNIAPGGTALGWIVYDVPDATVITSAQFTLDSGFADTGQWAIP